MWALLMVLLALAGAFGRVTTADDFEGSGVVVENTYVGEEMTRSRMFRYSVKVGKGTWLIATTNAETRQFFQVVYEEGVLYSMLSDPDPKTNWHQVITPSNPDPPLVHSGSMRRQEVPDDKGGCVRELWLAYASGDYFKKHRIGDLVIPVYPLDDPTLREENFKVRASWELSDNPPNLLAKIDYYSDGKYRTFTNGKRKVFSVPAPFDKGYVHASFSRESSTNLGGLNVPSHFLFQRFMIWKGSLVPRVSVEGFQESLQISRFPKGFRPLYTGIASIGDGRFAVSNPPVRPFLYHAKDGRWPEMSDPKVQTNYAMMVRNERIIRELAARERVAGRIRR